MPPAPKFGNHQQRILHRRNMVLRYTVAGFPLDQIQSIYNQDVVEPEHQVSMDTLRDDRKAVMQQLSDDFEGNRKTYRALLLERADLVLRTLYPAVKSGNLGAIDRWLRTLDLIGNVSGANAPLKVEFEDKTTLLSMDERKDKLREMLDVARTRAQAQRLVAESEIIDVTPMPYELTDDSTRSNTD